MRQTEAMRYNQLNNVETIDKTASKGKLVHDEREDIGEDHLSGRTELGANSDLNEQGG